MLSPLPRRSDWKYSSLDFPAVSAFPERVVGSACASTFSRLARCSLTLRPAHSLNRLKRSLYIGGSSHFVTSMTAPIASGRSDLAGWVSHPLVKRRLCTAHTQTGLSRFYKPAIQPIQILRTRDLQSRHWRSHPNANSGYASDLVPQWNG